MPSYALDVIRECGEAWERLITGKTAPGGVSTYVSSHSLYFTSMLIECSANVSVSNSPSRIPADQLPPLPAHQEVPPEKIDSSIDKWFFISGASA